MPKKEEIREQTEDLCNQVREKWLKVMVFEGVIFDHETYSAGKLIRLVAETASGERIGDFAGLLANLARMVLEKRGRRIHSRRVAKVDPSMLYSDDLVSCSSSPSSENVSSIRRMLRLSWWESYTGTMHLVSAEHHQIS